MKARGRIGAGRLTLIACMVIALVFAISGSAYAVMPTVPTFFDAYPNGSNQVVLQWTKSTDATPTDVITYQIYRSQVPITQTMINSASPLLQGPLTPVSLVSTEPTITATVTADTNEIADVYVWYYAVRATDGTNTSNIGYTLSPNLHGYRTSPSNVSACQRCHNVHGAPTPPGIVDRSSWICYYCHGRADNSATGPGDRSTYNTKADFYDYDNLPADGSRHRSAKMTANNNQCQGCHTPHRASYYYSSADGINVTYDPLQSFRLYLRVQTGWNTSVTPNKPTYTNGYYSNNSVATESTAFCFSCHGSTNGALTNDQGVTDGAADVNMGYVSDTGYADTAGDHNETGYASVAHGTSTIYSNNYGAARQNDLPQVQCLTCHEKHASAADKLIAYRGDDTVGVGTYAKAELCYACHKSGSEEANQAIDRTPTSNAPYSWNGRDVYAQFQKASKHPTTINTATTPATVLQDTWSDSTQAEFQAYGTAGSLGAPGLFQTSYSLIVDAICLAQTTTSVDLPAEPWIFANRGAATTFDGFDLGSQTWNDGFNPADHTAFSPASGSSSYWVEANQRFYTTVGGTNTQYVFNPATNGWATGQTLSTGNIGIGGDTAVNSGTGNSWVYYTQAGGTAGIKWWNYTNTAIGGFNFYYNNANVSLGQGSAIAYAPDCDRLFVLNRNGTATQTGAANDGYLYYRITPDNSNTTTNFTRGPVVANYGTTAYYNRMTYFKKAGAEYLMVVGRDSTGRFTKIIRTLDGAPVVLTTFTDPFGASLADGCDLEWDGGDYIYVVRGGANRGFRRIMIPADPSVAGNWNVGSSVWSAELPNPPWDATNGTWGNYSSIAVGKYDPPAANMTVYYQQGSANTGDIVATSPADHWGTVSWTEAENTGSFTVTVQGYNGATWVPLASSVNNSGIDLSSFTVETYPKIRLIGEFTSSADRLSTPVLYDWSVTTTKVIQLASRSGTCVSCHNVHTVSKGGTAAWDISRVSDPANTKNAVSGSTPTSNAYVNFCLGCHSSTPPSRTADSATLVPYSVGFSDQRFAPFFPGWDKTASGVSWTSGGHATTTIKELTGDIGCDTCHDPHASDNARLTAYSFSESGANPSHTGTVSRNNTSTYAEQDLCYACHANTRSGTCSSAGCHATSLAFMNAQTPFAATYRHPVETANRHSDTESGTSGLGVANRHSECADCHDPHATRRGTHAQGSSKAGLALVGASGVAPDYAGIVRNLTNTGASNFAAPQTYSATRIADTATSFEAYLCFKCHSGYSGQPFTVTTASATNYTSTDTAREFNPSNGSVHNVLGQSIGMQNAFTIVATDGLSHTTTWALPLEDRFLVTGLTANSMITCTECHTNDATGQAVGPHGSAARWLLDPEYITDWKTASISNTNANGMSSTTIICAKCHDLNGRNSTANWSNNVHAEGSHQGGTRYCITCHVKIPHGWARPRLLGTTLDNPAYASTGIDNWPANVSFSLTNSQVQWSQSGSCDTGGSCGTEHGGTAPWWPAY